jgi:hypothetical protein
MVTRESISLFVKRQRSLIVGRQRGAGPTPDLPTSSYLCGDAILIICAISAIDKPGQGESPLRMSLPGDFPVFIYLALYNYAYKDGSRLYI